MQEQANDLLFGNLADICNSQLWIDFAGGCTLLDRQELYLTPLEYKRLCLRRKIQGRY